MKKLVLGILVCTLLLTSACAANGTVIELPPLPENSAAEGLADTGAPISPDIFAPGFSAPVDVEMTADTYKSGDIISYKFINRRDTAVNILNIPSLYEITPNGLEVIKLSDTVGFCGTPDCLAANSESLLWTLDPSELYDSPLNPGQYLLKFNVLDDDYNLIDFISCDFKIIVSDVEVAEDDFDINNNPFTE